ncbi:hypothetical protein QBC38DRAFT_507760 [Podospora fimiseda]|uniref:AAA+ ATPase domain-containing protein n=1 Tax=Podospora fimiseda TaxID=252190 RepID=A0AAN7H2F0_9PEZI|nr:hypothetical protein QBC38DRAFT_507760 [Podospora fimiseda]
MDSTTFNTEQTPTRNDNDSTENNTTNSRSAPTGTSKRSFADIVEHRKLNYDGGYSVKITPSPRYTQTNKKTILRRTVMQKDHQASLLSVELEIQSQVLCRALRKIIKNIYEDVNLEEFPLKLLMPFKEPFFYRAEIEELSKKADTDPQLRTELEYLRSFTHNNGLLSSIIHDHDKHIQRGQVVGDILWTIYPPNSIAVLNVDEIKECWVVRQAQPVYSPHAGAYHWHITGFTLGYDGKKPGLLRRTCIVARVSMEIYNISDLPLVPIKFYKTWNDLEGVLRTRAATVRNVLGSDMSSFKVQNYRNTGWNTVESSGGYGISRAPFQQEKQIEERIMVDYHAYLKTGEVPMPRLEDLGRGKPQAPVIARGIVSNAHKQESSTQGRASHQKHGSGPSKTEDEDQQVEGVDIHGILEYKTVEEQPETHLDNPGKPEAAARFDLTELATIAGEVLNISAADFDLLFPAILPAYGLKCKKWWWIQTDTLESVQWNTKAYHALQLDLETKKLVEALVKGHKRSLAMGFDDLITGKGQGLVFLLHGKPGLGKTLTAESVAEHLERPLYSISGELDAVALLDEADVLLCKRNSAEMERNAIVGVFLRKLEYFQGILFLTTNRKQDFDEAFKSRIHVTFSYPSLDSNAQTTIWRRLIERNSDVKIDVVSWTDEVYSTLGRLNLNGRTIKNILRTAVAYACADGGDTQSQLEVRHVVAMVKTEVQETDDMDTEIDTEEEKAKARQVQWVLEKLQDLAKGKLKA